MIKRILPILAALALSVPALAQTPDQNTVEHRTLALSPDKLGIDISPTLAGIFFEDINQSVDGGICAQLIQNHSFQAYNAPDGPANEFSQSDTVFFGWTVLRGEGAKGTVRVVDDKPLVKDLRRWYDYDPNDKYDDELRYKQYSVRFDIDSPGAGFGIAANGYGIAEYKRGPGLIYSDNTQVASIPAKEGVVYDLGLYLQGAKYKGSISVYLEDAAGRLNSNVLIISDLGKDWRQHLGKLKAQRSVDSRLAIVADAKGTFWLDFVTLVPEGFRALERRQIRPFPQGSAGGAGSPASDLHAFPGRMRLGGPELLRPGVLEELRRPARGAHRLPQPLGLLDLPVHWFL
jgi:hypothetical protein